jgi:hypothetical protein
VPGRVPAPWGRCRCTRRGMTARSPARPRGRCSWWAGRCRCRGTAGCRPRPPGTGPRGRGTPGSPADRYGSPACSRAPFPRFPYRRRNDPCHPACNRISGRMRPGHVDLRYLSRAFRHRILSAPACLIRGNCKAMAGSWVTGQDCLAHSVAGTAYRLAFLERECYDLCMRLASHRLPERKVASRGTAPVPRPRA